MSYQPPPPFAPSILAYLQLHSPKTADLFQKLHAVSTTHAVELTEKRKPQPTEAEKQKAEHLKAQANTLVKEKKFEEAVQKYTEAIEICEETVYLANRAAAYSQIPKHQLAVDDCKRAVELDPNYSKAYSRMGFSYYGLAEYAKAVEVYEVALKLDPENAPSLAALKQARQRVANQTSQVDKSEGKSKASSESPAPSSGMGGMPDLSALLNNPALAGLQDQMKGAGGLEGLMKNPELMNMASKMMKDPSIMSSMMNMMGGGGAPK